jgi:LisH
MTRGFPAPTPLLQAQLRSQVLSKLQQSHAVSRPPASQATLLDRAVASLFSDYLEHSGFRFTQSVFQPESGLTSSSTLSEEEILEVLNMPAGSAIANEMQRQGAAGCANVDLCCRRMASAALPAAQVLELTLSMQAMPASAWRSGY